MAAATAGRIRNPHTLGEAYCNLITACANAGDWERASEWCELVNEFASRQAIVPLYGACRTIHADVLVAAGRWQDAEAALADALDAHARHYPAMGAPTVAALALIRISQGRLAEAGQLLAGRDENPSALLALPQLRLAEGEPQVATALLERGLANCRRRRPGVVAAAGAAGRRAARRRRRSTGRPGGGELLHDVAGHVGADARRGPRAARVGPRRAGRGDMGAAHEYARLALDAVRTSRHALRRRRGAPRARPRPRGRATTPCDRGGPRGPLASSGTSVRRARMTWRRRFCASSARGRAPAARGDGELTGREQPGARPARAGHDQRPDRQDPVHLREDRGPPREPHPRQARASATGRRPPPRRRVSRCSDPNRESG